MIYEAFLFLDGVELTPDGVWDQFWDTLMKDLGTQNRNDIYQKAAQYDLVLFADIFLDPEYVHEDKVGLGLWTENTAPKPLPSIYGCWGSIYLRRATAWRLHLASCR